MPSRNSPARPPAIRWPQAYADGEVVDIDPIGRATPFCSGLLKYRRDRALDAHAAWPDNKRSKLLFANARSELNGVKRPVLTDKAVYRFDVPCRLERKR